jgi:carbonic anhydrase/acetyltransferase-like protein (isoleucine patch superfamily)
MSTDIKKKTGFDMALLVPVFLCIMGFVPVLLSLIPLAFMPGIVAKIVWLSLAPIVAAIGFCLLAGLLTKPFHAAIRPGKFPRDTRHSVYGPRRIYGLCWGAVFYSGPVYYAMMSWGPLRTLVLRLFGFKGHASAIIAPDAWIRDLPILDIQQGAYVANKSTIGTNICLANGLVFVDSVTLGPKSLVGHLVMLAPGCVVGERSEIGVGCGIGIRTKMGAKVRIGAKSVLGHGCLIGDGVETGLVTFIGTKASIAPGLVLPPGCSIPDGAEVNTQAEVQQYFSSETQTLAAERGRLEALYNQSTGTSAVVVSAPMKASLEVGE